MNVSRPPVPLAARREPAIRTCSDHARATVLVEEVACKLRNVRQRTERPRNY
jgi:hypothetical protein